MAQYILECVWQVIARVLLLSAAEAYFAVSRSAVTNLRWCPTGNRRVPSNCVAVTATGGVLALYDVNSRSGLSLIAATQDAEDEYYQPPQPTPIRSE